MIREDINMLTDEERGMLDDSFATEADARRTRSVLFSSGAAVLGLFLFGQLGLSVGWFASMAAAILTISVVEKFSYQRTMLSYESLIRKLVHRVEDLEGVPQSLDDSRPSTVVRKANKAAAERHVA